MQLQRHRRTCTSVARVLKEKLTHILTDTSHKSVIEVGAVLLALFGLNDLVTVEEWVYFDGEGVFRTQGTYVGSGSGTVLRIGKVHRPNHYFLLDSTINQNEVSDKLRDREASADRGYFSGVVQLTDSSNAITVAKIIDKGQYPWGRRTDDCKYLRRIYDALCIPSTTPVHNACAYVHIMFGLLTSPISGIVMDRLTGLLSEMNDPVFEDMITVEFPSESVVNDDCNDATIVPGVILPNVVPANQSKSTLYDDYEYPEELHVDSEYFPFDSKADSIIYLWDAPCGTNRLPVDRLTLLLQCLPLIGVDGLTCHTGQSFRDKYDVRLPLMDIKHVSVLKSIRHTRKAKSSSGMGEESDAVEQLTVQVPYFCPDEYIVRILADPLWCRTLRFGLQDVKSSEGITQFNQTPYAHELLRWSQLKYIDRFDDTGRNDPIVVGSWYAFKVNDDPSLCVCLVKQLIYEGGVIDRTQDESKDWWPLLHVEAAICNVQDTDIRNIKRVLPPGNTELIDAQDLLECWNVYRGGLGAYAALSRMEKRKYTAYLHDWDANQIPSEPEWQYPEVTNGDHFFFLSWLFDSFKATKSGKMSVDGFYQTLLNIDTRFHNLGESYKTISLIEPGVDLGEVSRAISASSQLRSGFKTYSAKCSTMVDVKGTLAMTPADLHQLSAQCRHGGSASTHNCPNCTVIISERTDVDIKATNFDHTRTRAQTDKIVDICLKWIHSDANHRGAAVPKSVISDIRREYAVQLEDSWYEGWEYDEHRQGFREPEHLFYYGIFREQLSWITESMDHKTLKQFIARVDSFEWPSGMPTLSFDFNPKRTKKRWGTDVSMSMYKQLFVAVFFILDGLTEYKYYKHFAKLWLWHLDMLDNHHCVDDIPELQQRGLDLIREGVKIMPSVYDRPNGHGVIELITRTLPALVYIRLVSSGNFERHHQLTKRTNPSRWFINNAMKSFNVVDTLRLLLHGTRWGPTREYVLGNGIRNLKDPQNPSKPHKLIQSITSVHASSSRAPPQSDQYHYHDDWFPFNYKIRDSSNHPLTQCPDSATLSSITYELKRIRENIDIGRCHWRYPRALRKVFAGGDDRVIRQGHSVLCEWDTTEATAKIHEIIELRYTPVPKRAGRPKKLARLMKGVEDIKTSNNEWRIVFIQVRYYNEVGHRRHPTRNTRIMTLDAEVDDQVFTCGHLVRQVLPVHSCEWEIFDSSTHCCQRNTSLCVTTSMCPRHKCKDCQEYTCADRNEWIHRIQHNYAHNHFEIADENHGLYFDGAKNASYIDFMSLNDSDDGGES